MELSPLSKRIYAILVDAILVFASLCILPLLGISGGIYALSLLFFGIAYEPICTVKWGQTVGHRALGIRVVNESGGNPSVGQAIVRVVVKGAFGFFSFLSMIFTGKALHDIFTDTRVVLVKVK